LEALRLFTLPAYTNGHIRYLDHHGATVNQMLPFKLNECQCVLDSHSRTRFRALHLNAVQRLLVYPLGDLQPSGDLAKIAVMTYQYLSVLGANRRYHRICTRHIHHVAQPNELVPRINKDGSNRVRNVLIRKKGDWQAGYAAADESL
jgi:hypothetical protein